MKTALLLITVSLALLTAADPTDAVYWSAAKTKDLDMQAASRLNKESGLGTSRLMDSAFILYREGNSMAEIHTKQADMIVARDGECTMIVGGKIVDGKPSGQDEIRGVSIEGGTRYPMTAGDTLYVPANTVHQFVIQPGRHFTATIIKVTPKP
jgi:hypothetical protein